jgi:2-haloacid dehalogenase
MPFRAVTFDVYSALFDIVSGLTDAVGDLFARRGIRDDAAAVARLWRRKHMEYLLVANALDREPASNRRAIESSARYALRGLTPVPQAADLAALAGAWERLPPWPETVAVLAEVRRRPLVLAALSNGDEDALRALLATLPVTFDHIISTEGGKFKPHPSVYQGTLARLGVRSDELLHVAGSATDAMGATAAGIRTVWVNRARDAVVDARLAPAHEVLDLRGVVPLLDGP